MQAHALSMAKEFDACHKPALQTHTLQLEETRRQQCRVDLLPNQWIQKEKYAWCCKIAASQVAEFMAAKWKRSSRFRMASAEATFARLESKWRRETSAMSLVQDKVSNMAYLQIIGMREDALPFIFLQLQGRRRYWFVALEAITQENPVEPGASFQEALDAWLDWGRSHDFI